MIWLSDLEKTFGKGQEKNTVFEEVNLLIPPKKVIGVIGGQHSGKSTLLKMIAGSELPTQGKVSVEGSVLWSGGVSSVMHRNMTLFQNLKFLCRLYLDNIEKMNETIEKILDYSGLHKYNEKLWGEIPTNERGVISHATILALDADWLLIDGGLTKKKNEKILKNMIEHVKRRSVLFASQNTKQLLEICDAGIVIHNKKLLYFDWINDALKFYKGKLEQ